MEAILISPFLLLLIAVISAALGWYWKKRTEIHSEEEYLVVEKAQNTLNKKVKQLTKDNARLKKQTDTWKEKVRLLETKNNEDRQQLKEELDTAMTNLQTKDKTIRQLAATQQNAKNDLERLKTTHAKLNEKYKEDIAALKEWRKNKDKFNRMIKDLNSRLKQSQEKVVQLTNTKAKLTKEIEENNAFVSKLRALKARNAKLQEDLTYWEKKHYDCQHELATLKARFEIVTHKSEQLELQNQSAMQTQHNMQRKVQEFKTRFVDINNKYHQLLESKN